MARTTRSSGSPKLSRRCVVMRTRSSSRRLAVAAGDREQRVDDGVARQEDLLAGHVLGLERPGGPPRRDEVGGGDEIHDAAVHLLGKRMLEVARAQPGLDVADADAPVERGERRAHRRRRVALHEEPVGLLAGEHRVEAGEDARGELVRRLVGPHQVEVDVGREREEREHLVEHLAMLRRRAENGPRIPAPRGGGG